MERHAVPRQADGHDGGGGGFGVDGDVTLHAPLVKTKVVDGDTGDAVSEHDAGLARPDLEFFPQQATERQLDVGIDEAECGEIDGLIAPAGLTGETAPPGLSGSVAGRSR